MKIPQIKKRQHYVWRKYLKQWATNNQIYCLQDGKIFQANLMNVAQEKYFYQINELPTNEKEELQELIQLSLHPRVQKSSTEWVEFFSLVHNLRSKIESSDLQESTIGKLLNTMEYNFEEEFHSNLENNVAKFYDQLYKQNTDFLKDDKQLLDFLFFLCEQYWRTKNIAEKVRKGYFAGGLYFSDAVFSVLRHIFASNMALHLYENRQQLSFVLLNNNNSAVPFITSDQPIINIAEPELPHDQDLNRPELFYPLKPNLALRVTFSLCAKFNLPPLQSIEMEINKEDIDFYNDFILKHSFCQLYGNGKAVLTDLSLRE